MAKADKTEPKKGPNELLQEFLQEHGLAINVRIISPSRTSDVSLADALHPLYRDGWTPVIRADWAQREE